MFESIYTSELRLIMVTTEHGDPCDKSRLSKHYVEDKKKTIPTIFCCFHALYSVLLSRLPHLLGFYHCDIILSEIVLITAGLFE